MHTFSVFGVLLICSFTVVAQNFSHYPPYLKKGPAPLQEWIDLFLKNASIPSMAVNKGAIETPDWSSDITSCPKNNSWAITYDDGPGPYTPHLLDALQAANVKATFFVIGSNILMGGASSLISAFNAGHQIGIHTWSHTPITTLTNEEILGEVMWTGTLIQQLTGVFPQYFRPPGGDIDARSRAILHAIGLEVVIWNKDSGDWMLVDSETEQQHGINASTVSQEFASWIKTPPDNGNGIISLEHDFWKDSEAAAPACLEFVLKAGYHVQPVGDCLSNPSPWYWSANNPSWAWSSGQAFMDGTLADLTAPSTSQLEPPKVMDIPSTPLDESAQVITLINVTKSQHFSKSVSNEERVSLQTPAQVSYHQNGAPAHLCSILSLLALCLHV